MKKHFPIFERNPDLIFLDNANTTQKPACVLEAHDHFMRYEYSNIQRGQYELAETAEVRYIQSKKIVAEWIGASSTSEIISTYSATYAANILAETLARNGVLQRGDTVLVSISEHHANLIPWLNLQKQIGIQIKYINLDQTYRLDLEHLQSLMDPTVKVLSVQHVSNVTGAIHPIENVRSIIGADCFLIIDMAQSAPHMPVNLAQIDCDAAFFSAHKMMGTTGLGILYAKKNHLKSFVCPIGGGGSINFVTTQMYEPAGIPYRWEPGTQHVAGMIALARSVLFLREHIQQIHEIERDNIHTFLTRLAPLIEAGIVLYGSQKSENRCPIFSLGIPDKHPVDIVEMMSREHICVRAGHHCCQPLHTSWEISGTLRASLYVYNDTRDIDTFISLLGNHVYGESF